MSNLSGLSLPDLGTRIAQTPATGLIPLLSEGHEVHAGRGAAEIARIRGFALTHCARGGVPPEAVLHVLGELQNGHYGYAVAAAARGVRSGERSALFTPYLVAALLRFAHEDERFDLDRIEPYWPLEQTSSVVEETLRSLEWLGPAGDAALPQLRVVLSGEVAMPPRLIPLAEQAVRAIEGAGPLPRDCCDAPRRGNVLTVRPPEMTTDAIADVTLEDQSGRRLSFASCFRGAPAVIAFFYTRCDNPNKCSLTITTLARVQQRLVELGLSSRCRLAAVTYDPEYDSPDRLRSYGSNRGMQFGPGVRALRPVGHEAHRLYEVLDIAVARSGSRIMGHQVEVLVLDADMLVREVFTRVSPDPETIVHALRRLLDDCGGGTRGTGARLGHVGGRGLTAIASAGTLGLAALFPKCPLCVAGYLAALGTAGGTAGISGSRHFALFSSLVAMFLIVQLIAYRRRRRLPPLAIAALGSALLLIEFQLSSPVCRAAGIVLMLAATAMQVADRVAGLPGHPSGPGRSLAAGSGLLRWRYSFNRRSIA